jgi:hypothetical protein
MGQKNGPVWQVGWFGPFFIFLLKSRKLKYIFGGTKIIEKKKKKDTVELVMKRTETKLGTKI